MTDGCILALDQGSSATKALLVRPDGSVAAAAEAPVQSHPVGPDGVELDPEEIWRSLAIAAGRVMTSAREVPAAVALANQGETVLAWDRVTGKPLSAAISWQDRRATALCRRMADRAEEVRAVTGLRLDPYFSAPKAAWLRECVTREGVVTTTDSWLLHRLTGEFVTDAATASRTMLLDLDSMQWSERMGEMFGVDTSGLPRIVDNDGVVGVTSTFGAEVPVAGVAVDQQAALLAEGCLRRGQAKCTYGTGAFLLATLGTAAARSRAGLVSCVAWRCAGETTYCLDGQVYTVGSALDWLRRVGVIGGPEDLDRLAGDVRRGAEVFVPAFAGLGAPHWFPRVRAAMTGMTLDTDRGSLVHAVLEGIAANVAVLAEATGRDLGRPVARLRADGGLTRSRVLMQLQADLLQVPVDVYPTADATALGVSALARLALGEAPTPADAVRWWRPALSFEPACSAEEAASRLDRWRGVVRQLAEAAGEGPA